MSGDHDDDRIRLVTQCLLQPTRSELPIAGGFQFLLPHRLYKHMYCGYTDTAQGRNGTGRIYSRAVTDLGRLI
jgi:hypothetical protein